MLVAKRLDDRLIRVHVCDRCNDIIEDRGMYLDGSELCPKCFGAWWEKVSQPLKRSEADSDKLVVSQDTRTS